MYMNFQLLKPRDESLSIIEQVFQNRGIENAIKYLNTTENDIHSPALLNNIEAAKNLLFKHLEDEESLIYVQVDSDNDGLASAALLLNYLHEYCPDVVENRIYWGLHAGKSHGIDIDAIAEGTKLVIAPDSSSEEFDIHAQLRARGIDVLILDHHETDRVSANAVVVNNQLDNYPNKTLCGAGIVWKFCQYLEPFTGIAADNYRDLAAWAIVADMMDLRDYETRRILDTGFNNLHNLFFSSMVANASYSLKGQLTPHGIAFYITPLVNAVMRVGTMEEKWLLFTAMLDWLAVEEIPSTKRGCKGQTETRVEQAVRMCTNVKNRQSRAEELSLEQIEALIHEIGALEHKVLLLQIPGTPDANLLGLNANKLMAKYQRPVILLRETDEGTWAGSARGVNGSLLTNFKKLNLDSDCVVYAQGHPNAHGVCFKPENISKYLEYTDTALADIDFSPAYKVDAIYQGGDFPQADVKILSKYRSVWGQEIPEPLLAITNVAVHKGNVTLMSPDKKPTIKISLPNGVECIKFKATSEEYEALTAGGCVHVNIVGTCDLNVYYSKETAQIIIKDYEIINTQEYYF